MLLYHVNLGWPVVDEGARLVVPARRTVPFDADAVAALDVHDIVGSPRASARQEVFEHRLEPPPAVARVSVVNPAFAPTRGIGAVVKCRLAELPRLWHWRMCGQGTYLTRIEPANCGIAGRDAERHTDTVDVLQPGERRSFELAIETFSGSTVERLAVEAAQQEMAR